jgi:hypothetical protein
MGSTLCMFCFACQQSRDHLFFSCSFNRRIWRNVIANCMIRDPPVEWDSLSRWCDAHLKGKSLLPFVGSVWGATVYHIWRHRNDLIHENLPRSEEVLVH